MEKPNTCEKVEECEDIFDEDKSDCCEAMILQNRYCGFCGQDCK